MKSFSQMAYAAGLLGSMALDSSRPGFEEVFPGCAETEEVLTPAEKSKLQMLAYAEWLNRKARNETREEGDKSG